MGAAPSQVPRIDLPGAEYFNLAPNATLALQGRRRRFISIAPTSIPASSTSNFNQSIILESPFQPSSGIYVHDAWVMYLPSDGTQELQINSSNIGLTTNSAVNTPSYPFGLPIVTQLSPAGSVVGLREQQKFIAGQDVIQATIGLIGSSTNNLSFVVQTFIKNNDPTNPHSMQIFTQIVYTRLDGILE